MSLLGEVFGKIRGNPFGLTDALHVQRAYNWELLLPANFGYLPGIVISKFCQSVSLGQYDINDVIELKTGAFKQFFPGQLNIRSVTASFVTPAPDIVARYFSAWKKRIVDDEGFYGVSSWYKKDIYVFVYDRTGVVSNSIRISGAFPVKFPAYALSYSAEDVVKFDVEFKIDKIKIAPTGVLKFGLQSIGRSLIGRVF